MLSGHPGLNPGLRSLFVALQRERTLKKQTVCSITKGKEHNNKKEKKKKRRRLFVVLQRVRNTKTADLWSLFVVLQRVRDTKR